MASEQKTKHRENLLLNIGLNIAVPVIILTWFSDEGRLGPVLALVIALAFPLAYGLYDFGVRGGFNFYSAIGFVSVLLTGGIGLLKLPVELLAIKEAAVPLLVAVAVLGSLRTKYPIVKIVLHKIIDEETVYKSLHENNRVKVYESRILNTTYLILFGLLTSAVLNYFLARLVVVSKPGTVEFNTELGRMTALSFPVITLPSMTILAIALYYLVSGIIKETGLSIEEIVKAAKTDQ